MTEIQDLADRLRSALQPGGEPLELLAEAATALEHLEQERLAAQRELASSIRFDPTTGEQLEPFRPATGEVWHRIASTALPGTTPEQVADWYRAWFESDGLAFSVGSTVVGVNDPNELHGTVGARLVSDEGELHTVMVVWPGMVSAQAYSPRELREVPRG